MKKKSSLTKIGCSEIEELLIKQRVVENDLKTAESEVLKTHLATCEECAKYQRVLLKVSHLVAIENEFGLAPNSELKEDLSGRLRAKNIPVPKTDSTQKSFLDFLKIKIPVYQAAVGTLLLFLVFYAVSDYGLGNQEKLDSSPAIFNERPIADSLTMIQNIRLLESQKLGRNIEEDSLLIRFIVTSVELLTRIESLERKAAH